MRVVADKEEEEEEEGQSTQSCEWCPFDVDESGGLHENTFMS